MGFLARFFNRPGSSETLDKGIRDFDPGAWSQAGSSVDSRNGVSLRFNTAISKNLTPAEQYSLSIPVHSANAAIAQNISKAKGRLFTKSGEEIIGGPLFDLLRRPAPGLSYKKLIWEVSSWFNITGEFMIYQLMGADGKPARLLPLNPASALIANPTLPRTPGDIVAWFYTWADGVTDTLPAAQICFERDFNPNPYSVRGLSKLLVGGLMVTAGHYIEKYNKQFFENGAVPSHIVTLGDGVPRQVREDFEKRWTAEFGRYSDSAHKVAVVSGKDVKVAPIEQSFQDGAFMEMQKHINLKVGQLYRVPAINMGIYDNATRFQTVNEERKVFIEETLAPQCELISDAIQHQIVDRHFAFSEVQRRRPRLTKSMDAMLQKAQAENGESNIIFLIDIDTLPVAHDVKLVMTENALKLREAYMISPAAAERWAGMDFDDPRPEREEIWAESKYVCITDPSINAALVPGVKPAGEEGEEKPGEEKPDKPATKALDDPPPPVQLTHDSRAVLKKAEKFYRALRRLTLERMAEDGELWSLTDGDALNELGEPLHTEIRKARYALRQIISKYPDKETRMAEAKKWFNAADRAYLRKALGL